MHPLIGSSDAGLGAGASSEILILLHATVIKVTRNCTVDSPQEERPCLLVLGQSKDRSPCASHHTCPYKDGLGLSRKVAGWESGNLSSSPT